MLSNPFPGPLPYSAADQDQFFGREEVSADIQSSILAHRSVTIYGPNGVGKSSVMRASVLPTLIQQHRVQVARVNSWPERQDLMRWLVASVYISLGFDDPPDDMEPREAVMYAAKRLARRSERLLVIQLDQVEQLLYAGRKFEQVEAVFTCMNELVDSPLRNLRLVLVLREGYLARFLDMLREVDRMRDRSWVLAHGFRVPALTVAEITTAACEAAKRGKPPQTWTAEQVRPLMIEARAAGHAATDHAEVQSTSAQIACRALFNRLAEGAEIDGTLSGLFRLDARTLALLDSDSKLLHVPAVLRRLLKQPFTLVLADLEEDRGAFFRALTELARSQGEEPEGGTSLQGLIEWSLRRFGQQGINMFLERYLTTGAHTTWPLIGTIARFIKPGIHLAASWEPQLPRAIAEKQPNRNVYAVLPSLLNAGDAPYVLKRPAGATWQVEPRLSEAFDPNNDIMVLGLYGGFSTKSRPIFTQPSLGEDALIRDILTVEGILTPKWIESLVSDVPNHPGLFIGLSALDWRHRKLLSWLYDQHPAPGGSLAILTGRTDPSEPELWNRGAGLHGSEGIPSISEDADILAMKLQNLNPEAIP